MRQITYLQGAVVLADVGSGAAALALPQDEVTAVVRIAAILARNYGTRMPGEYRAVVDTVDETGEKTVQVVVTEEDPWVVQARDLLAAIATDREYTAAELNGVRQALIDSVAPLE